MSWIITGLTLQFGGALVMIVGFIRTWNLYHGMERFAEPLIDFLKKVPREVGDMLAAPFRRETQRGRASAPVDGRGWEIQVGGRGRGAVALDSELGFPSALQRELDQLKGRIEEVARDDKSAREALRVRVDEVARDDKSAREALLAAVKRSVRAVAIGGLRLQGVGLAMVTVGAIIAAVPSLRAG